MLELRVAGDDRQPFLGCLCDKQPVERVSVMGRQILDGEDVLYVDRQRGETVRGKLGGQPGGRSVR